MQRPQLIGLLLTTCLAALLAPPKAAVAGNPWVDSFAAGPFLFRSEFPLDPHRALLAEIVQLKTDMEHTLGLSVSDRPIEVNLFRNKRSYQEFVSKRIPGGERRQALYVRGPDRGRVYVYQHRDFETDVRHECTHALLHNSLPFLPMWLDEGLAEYFEVPAGARLHDNPHLRSVRLAVRFGWRPKMERLEKKRNFNELNAKDYRDSWACVHFMLHGSPRARQVLLDYLQQIQNGTPPGSLRLHLEHAIPDIERQMAHHFRNWKK